MHGTTSKYIQPTKPKRNMILYHQSPFHFYPNTRSSISWSPHIITTSPTASSLRRCGNKKQKICGFEKASENGSSIIYQDRNTRIQHINDNKVEFSLDLPGIKVSDVKVEIHNGILKLEAERKHSNDRTTKVERCFSIKDIAAPESDDIHASLEDGVLRVIIPKNVDEEKAEEEKLLPIPVGVELPIKATESDSGNEVRFSVDLPGVSLANVKLDVSNDTISLLATRKLFDKESTTKRHFTIDTDKVDNTSFKGYLVDGVLTLVGLKKVVPGPKQIVVSDGSSSKKIENATETKKDDDMVIVETVEEEAQKN